MEKQNRYSKIRHEFLQKYNNELLPFLLKFENERKQVLKKAVLLSSLSLLVVLALLYLYLSTDGKKNDDILMLLAVPFAIWGWFQYKFESKIKEKIMPKVCDCFGDLEWINVRKLFKDNDDSRDIKKMQKRAAYRDKQTLKADFYISSGLVRSSEVSFDDVFTGSWDGVNLDITEADFHVGSGKNRNTVFDGVFIVLDMNKPFDGHTVIKQKGIIINGSPFKHLNTIKLEDVDFNKTYNVFSTDEVEARYLITPSFMERLKRMKVAFTADKISCAFYNNYLIIGLETNKDLFSIASIRKNMNDSKQYFQMFEEILSIIKLIDYFKLNQKIGL